MLYFYFALTLISFFAGAGLMYLYFSDVKEELREWKERYFGALDQAREAKAKLAAKAEEFKDRLS